MQETITTLEDSNAQLRAAVENRLAASMPTPDQLFGSACCDGGKCQPKTDDAPQKWRQITQASAEKYAAERAEPEEQTPSDWILQGQREIDAHSDDIRWTGDSILAAPAEGFRPGSREFVDVLEEIKDLHLRKTLDYGVDQDALSNIRESADIVNMPAWAGAILRISDKMHRLKAYFRRGKVEFDGLSDTLKDIASYAVIAEVLRREEQTDPV